MKSYPNETAFNPINPKPISKNKEVQILIKPKP